MQDVQGFDQIDWSRFLQMQWSKIRIGGWKIASDWMAFYQMKIC